MPGAPSGSAALDAASDIFLHVEGRGGPIRGESTTSGHTDDIELRSWQWGVSAGSAIGSGAATARRSYRNLVVTKGIDRATTALYAALVQNVDLREVVLTMRKAGGEALDYFRVALGNARVVDVALDVDLAARPVERVTFSFRRITVTYTPQQGGGSG
ncbi:MAG TPA: type VI secretion system tube protein Hcp, partial [Albitalea sp.]|nr:type VI secretion system tube protein Hcp [Albitalea sp.]